ncbi:MAG: tetratricopeptide repeat protein [Planctomycetales bacterium]|nr:tetratricopeptide repeat protein [Planctomycetales bacterium]MBN8628794.1 tetratricopeptide repeat protein [Planctomycetota bacterium]
MCPARRKTTFLCALLGLTTLAVYARTATFDFVPIDDTYYVAENLRVQAGLTPANIRWAFTTTYLSNWHPLTWLSYMLDCQLFGPGPAAMHVVNVLWHVVNSVLLLLMLKSLTGSFGKSAFVAFLFALHPLHVESVAWISERKDVMSGFFFISTLGAYATYVRNRSLLRYLLVATLLALGLLAKPMLVTLPCVLLLLDYWPLNRMPAGTANSERARSGTSLILEKLPLFGIVAASSVVTYLAQLHGNSVTTLDRLAPATRFANAAIAYLAYLGKTIWPANLAVLYPHPGISPEGDTTDAAFLWRGVAASVLLAVLTLLFCVLGRKRRYLTVGWLWFLGTLVPVIGIVQVGSQSLADRYTYLPHVGIFIMIAWGVPDLIRGLVGSRAVLTGAAFATISCCCIVCVLQIRHWQNGVTLFSHNFAVCPHPKVEYSLGSALLRSGRPTEAVTHFENVLNDWPDDAATLNLYGVALHLQGRKFEALTHYRRSVELDPTVPRVRYNYANLLADEGHLDAAVHEYRQSLRLERLPKTHNNLGAVLLKQGRFVEAAAEFSAALEISPAYQGARSNLDRLLAEHPGLDVPTSDMKRE